MNSSMLTSGTERSAGSSGEVRPLLVAVIRFTGRFRRPRLLAAPTGRTPMVTVLKPLCGADDALEQNLESFFRQAGARYELVFGVEGDDDPRALRPAPR